MPKNESFTDITEDFLKEIVKEVRTSADCDIKTKVEVLRELTRWVQIKNKVDPSGGEGSKIDEYRAALAGGSTTGGNRNTGRNRGGASAKARAKIDKLEAKNEQKIPHNSGYRNTGASGQNAGDIQDVGNGFVNPPEPIPFPDRGNSDGIMVSPVGGGNKNRGFGSL